MRRTLGIIVLVSVVVSLSACFGTFFKKGETSRPAAAPSAPTVESPVVPEPGQSEVPPAAPSFQDGDFYIEAVSTRSTEPCKKIASENLRARCEIDAKGGA